MEDVLLSRVDAASFLGRLEEEEPRFGSAGWVGREPSRPPVGRENPAEGLEREAAPRDCGRG